jgi:Nucleoporin complex subunit 54
MIPVVAIGFEDLHSRVRTQNERIALYQEKVVELDFRLNELLKRKLVDNESKKKSLYAKSFELSINILKVGSH